MTLLHQSKARFSVGNWVSFPFGSRGIAARITEDRGSIGMHGRRLYGLRIGEDGGQPDLLELPEEQLTPLFGAHEVVDYLAKGGLVKILNQNAGGGKNPPRAWLTRTPNGSPTHTFSKEMGLIGGAVIPFFTIDQARIFTPRRGEVGRFLAAFGLTRDEVEKIISTMGTSP